MDHATSALDTLRGMLQAHVFEFLLAAFLLGILTGAILFKKKVQK